MERRATVLPRFAKKRTSYWVKGLTGLRLFLRENLRFEYLAPFFRLSSERF